MIFEKESVGIRLAMRKSGAAKLVGFEQQLQIASLLVNFKPTQIMRLLHYDGDGNLSLTEFFESDRPKYAILSHRWETEEYTFNDL